MILAKQLCFVVLISFRGFTFDMPTAYMFPLNTVKTFNHLAFSMHATYKRKLRTHAMLASIH